MTFVQCRININILKQHSDVVTRTHTHMHASAHIHTGIAKLHLKELC
jgi:hypothetical protein